MKINNVRYSRSLNPNLTTSKSSIKIEIVEVIFLDVLVAFLVYLDYVGIISDIKYMDYYLFNPIFIFHYFV